MQTNSELIQRVIANRDPKAFECLVERYERLVWTVVWHRLRDYHLTQDVTQDTFLIAHQRLAELQNPDSLGFWLSTIAGREADKVKKLRKASQPFTSIDVQSTDKNAVSDDNRPLLEAIGALPDHEREVIVLRYINSRSMAEVAQLTGRSVGTVTKQISRGLNRLRVLLEKQERRAIISNPELRLFDV